ncbi:MAG: hypothetical protein JNJ65_03185 [Cyclobacteriaceae bacterium]|nr:hypothetical protein [Cyclobacteriaceae bacterium]
MARRSKTKFNPWLLMGISITLMTAGWLMKSFPVLMFVGLAPLFAIADQAKDHASPWNRFELILLALVVTFVTAHVFDFSYIIFVCVQAIALTLAFVGYAFSYQNLGSRLGKFTIIFFWLGLEYAFLKLPWRNDFVFLSDALLILPTWCTWNVYTGYLGGSVWILVVNLLFYLSVFREGGFSTLIFIVALVLIAAPILYSYQTDESTITRLDMLSVYSNTSPQVSEKYLKQSELAARTAAWISVLIILLAFVKNQTRKK